MEEETITVETDVQPTGAPEALPVENTDNDTADTQAVAEPSQPQSDVNDASAVDEKLKVYATSQGLELDSPSAIKAAQIAMKAQSEATRNYHKSNELERTIQANSDEIATQVAEDTGQDPELLKIVRGLQVNQAVRDFWDAHPEARQYEQEMIKVHAEKPYLAGDLEALYATALVKSGGLDAVKSQGKREVLTNLAQKQQATAPIGNATNSGAPKAKPFKELSIAEMEAQLGFVRR